MSYALNHRAFHDQFKRFKAAVLALSHQPFVSFGTGLPRTWERYKDFIYDKGRSQLGVANWKQEEVGSGEILRRVISAIEIDVPDENQKKRVPNNLVDWDKRFGPEKRSHLSLYEAVDSTTNRFAYESLLYDFYREELSPEDAFGSLVEQAGKRYDFIAYLFFLKDWTRYLPISPANFDKAFAMLDVGLKTSQQCSWVNYQSYLNVIRQVRNALRDAGMDDVRLIDAHSFCYMLARMKLPEVSATSPIVPEPLVIGAAAIDSPEPTQPAPGGGGDVDFDWLRDERAALGGLAEDIAFDAEEERLRRAGRSDLAERIERVADDHTKGYDIKSFNDDGTDRFIEVKAVRAESHRMSFYLTENERQKAEQLPNYFFYLVVGARTEGRAVKYLRAADCPAQFLHPLVHIAIIPLQPRQQS